MSSIAFYRLNQPSLTTFVLAVTVFLLLKKSSYAGCNFIIRMLFYDIYWLSVPPELFYSMTMYVIFTLCGVTYVIIKMNMYRKTW